MILSPPLAPLPFFSGTETPINYSALFLAPEEQAKLLSAVAIPEGWTRYADHCTVEYRPQNNRFPTGTGQLSVTAIRKTHDTLYAVVTPPEDIQAWADLRQINTPWHITIATAPGVPPVQARHAAKKQGGANPAHLRPTPKARLQSRRLQRPRYRRNPLEKEIREILTMQLSAIHTPLHFGQKPTLMKLPFDLDRYFTRDANTLEVPLDKLTPIRARTSGIQHANQYMYDAYNGLGDRRKPITLKDNGDGTYTIRDGNSTYANARHSGWPTILARVLSDAEFATEEAAKQH